MPENAITGALRFQTLQDRFADDLRRLLGDGDATVWVLAPTNLLALHLRRHAARRLGGVLGVEFITLREAARRLTAVGLAERGLRPVSAEAVELAVRRMLEEAPPGAWSAQLAGFPNGAAAACHAIRLLEDCLWKPGLLQDAAPAAATDDPDAPGRLRELAALWNGLREWKTSQGLFEAEDLPRLASADGGPCPADTVLLYGFYDFTPAQRALVARILGGAACARAYLLWSGTADGPGPGFEYAAPTVAWLQERLGVGAVDCCPAEGGRTDLDRLAEGIFGEYDVIAADEARRRADGLVFDGSVRLLSCPGDWPEACEAAREALRTVSQGSDPPASAGILMRAAAGSAPLLAEAIDRTGLGCYFAEGLPLSDTVPGRVALALVDLSAGDAERADVVDFLSLAEIDWPPGLSATAIDRASRRAGVTRGRAEWVRRLTERGAQLSRDAERAESEDEAAALAREAEACARAASFMEDIFSTVGPLASGSSWAQIADELDRLTARFSPAGDEDLAAVRDLIAGLGELDVAGVPPDSDLVRHVLGGRLAGESRRRNRFQHVAVTAASVMAVRGATFDDLVVTGLIERGFPRHLAGASLLTEPDRQALNGCAERLGVGRLPVQRERPLEERYLFRICIGSAGRRIVLCWPRIEQHTGRPRIASRFLAAAASCLCGFSMDASQLDGGLAGLVERVPLTRRRWPPEALQLALDVLEYDEAVFAGPEGDLRRTDYLAEILDPFRRAVAMDRARWKEAAFGPYDGKIRDPEMVRYLAERHGRFDAPVSASRLEMYASCPFEYFMSYVLGVRGEETPAEEFELPPLERGSLVHDLLKALYEERFKGELLGRLSDADVESAVARAGELLDRLGRGHAEDHPATWGAEREKTLDQVRALLEHERAEHGTGRPSRFEFAFGMEGEPGFEYDPGDGRPVTFRGRIDRIDDLTGGIRIIDYKTGKSSRYKPDRLTGGTQLQLPIYLLAATALLGTAEGEALYLAVGEPKDVPEFTLSTLQEREGDFRRALALIRRGIASGDFFPFPAQSAEYACESFCRFRNVCGAARRFVAEMKQADPDLGPLDELRAIE
jgi:RecB family exonuclease